MGCLRANLGASWSQLGGFWCQLGGLGGNLTGLCGCCKKVAKTLSFYRFVKDRRVMLEGLGGQVGGLEASWRHLGGILEAFGGSWKLLEASWRLLDPSWRLLGPSQTSEPRKYRFSLVFQAPGPNPIQKPRKLLTAKRYPDICRYVYLYLYINAYMDYGLRC